MLNGPEKNPSLQNGQASETFTSMLLKPPLQLLAFKPKTILISKTSHTYNPWNGQQLYPKKDFFEMYVCPKYLHRYVIHFLECLKWLEWSHIFLSHNCDPVFHICDLAGFWCPTTVPFRILGPSWCRGGSCVPHLYPRHNCDSVFPPSVNWWVLSTILTYHSKSFISCWCHGGSCVAYL